MKKLFYILTLISIFSLTAFAQQKGTLKGKLEDEKGKPIVGAEVRVMSSRTRKVQETATDKDGNYVFELDADSYTLSFDAEGRQGGTLRVMQQVEEGKETKVKTYQLPKARRTSLLRGSVFDEQGFSLQGVRLKLQRIRNDEEARENKKIDSVKMEYISNSRGEFAFRLPPVRARYQVTAILSGYKPQTKTVDVGEDESVPLAFTLEPVKE
ncbi:MAG: carboxypeptidase-like regulatory domain-containing protein [Acidobacteriota bacterium]